MTALHGRIALSILIVQDLIAVGFLAASTGKWPSPMALLLLGLIPLRPALQRLLRQSGHGELLVLYGLILALGGAELFELVGLKGDLGALIVGILIAGNERTEELAKTLLGFKDLFLLGFFLSIGQAGIPTLEMAGFALLLLPFVLAKSALYFALLCAFRLRARTSLLASLNLANYSEFGLIVAAIGVSNGWLGDQWLIILALALAFSFTLAAPLSARSNALYRRFHDFWKRFEHQQRIPDEQPFDLQEARIVIVGMGGVGSGTYDAMIERGGHKLIGVDVDPVVVRAQRDWGRWVIEGDPSDPDFWSRMRVDANLDLVMVTLPRFQTIRSVVRQLRKSGYRGRIAATALFPDQEQALLDAGADEVFNTATEAGAGFAAHVLDSAAKDSRTGD
jgi:hypothetical protein